MSDAPDSAHLVLAENVVHLDLKPALFEAMLTGWARQQRSRLLQESGTIAPRERVLRRFAAFTGLCPCDWTSSGAEAWISELHSGNTPLARSTIRGYEVMIRLFCEYLTDQRYGWVDICTEQFGNAPELIFHESNSVLHIVEYEGDPRRRPLTYDEVQAWFDAADPRVETIRRTGRKGSLAAIRDSAMLKFTYAFGVDVDAVDLRRNVKAPQSSRGGPPKPSRSC